MAEPLKNLYTKEYIQNLASKLKKVYPAFKEKSFVSAVMNADWQMMELKQRMHHIALCLNDYLPVSFQQQLTHLHQVAPHFNGYLALFFPDFVATFGLEDPDNGIPSLEYLTQFSSSEFAVRPFIVKYEKRMLKQHASWAKHKNHHVRRLASEGIRPRLPWAMSLPAFKKEPKNLIPILSQLKQDESEYVRRSVANCLNDISKDHPQVLLDIINEWQGISEPTNKLLKHASRGLLKSGDVQALNLFGLNHQIKANITKATLNRSRLKIGEKLGYSFNLQLMGKTPEDIRLEYKIYYQKSNGKLQPKIFQIGTYMLKARESIQINRFHAFANLTTRVHYPGEHRWVLVVNGKESSMIPFELLA